MSIRNKVLSTIFGLFLLAAISAIAYVINSAPMGDRFTEFYLLGVDSKAEEYPKELVVGEERRVIVGIINQEYDTVSYRVEVSINGIKNNEVGPVILRYGEIWEGEVSFVSEAAGEEQKVEFFLFKQGESEPYSCLYLWLDVTQ